MSEENQENIYVNNPLHGVGLKTLLEEIVGYYGFDILYAYLNMNCFKTNPGIAACAKFLKKTDWAREKVELFYLYQYKNLPAVSSEQFNIAPRERIVPKHQKPGEPAILSIEDGQRLRHKREKNVASRNSYSAERKGSSRAYNERRGGNHQSKSANRGQDGGQDRGQDGGQKGRGPVGRQGSQSGYYKVAERKTDESVSSGIDDQAAEPVPAIDPWGIYKKRK